MDKRWMTRCKHLLASSGRAYWLPLGASVLLIGAIAAHSASLPGPADAEPYYQRVRQAVGNLPDKIGPWRAKEAKVPRAAFELLRPNAIRMRRHTRADGGPAVSMLVVHCKDARDLLGHYPPKCYPATGWHLEKAKATQWSIGDTTIPGMAYTFTRPDKAGDHGTVVYNFLVTPDGQLVPQISDLWDPAADPRRRFYGAAQVQLLIDSNVAGQRRDGIVTRFLRANRALIQALRSVDTVY